MNYVRSGKTSVHARLLSANHHDLLVESHFFGYPTMEANLNIYIGLNYVQETSLSIDTSSVINVSN